MLIRKVSGLGYPETPGEGQESVKDSVGRGCVCPLLWWPVHATMRHTGCHSVDGVALCVCVVKVRVNLLCKPKRLITY